MTKVAKLATLLLREEVEAEARKRKLSALKQNADDRERNLREREKGKTSVVVAKRVGMSERTYEKARKVVSPNWRDQTYPASPPPPDREPARKVAARLANMRQGDNQHSSIDPTSQSQAAAMLNVGVAPFKRPAPSSTRERQSLLVAKLAKSRVRQNSEGSRVRVCRQSGDLRGAAS